MCLYWDAATHSGNEPVSLEPLWFIHASLKCKRNTCLSNWSHTVVICFPRRNKFVSRWINRRGNLRRLCMQEHVQQPLALSLPATFQTPGKHSCPKIEKILVLFNSFVDAWIQLNVEVSLSKILRTKSTFCEILVADINLHFGFSSAGKSWIFKVCRLATIHTHAGSCGINPTGRHTCSYCTFPKKVGAFRYSTVHWVKNIGVQVILAWLQPKLHDTKKMLHIAIVLTFFSLTEP